MCACQGVRGLLRTDPDATGMGRPEDAEWADRRLVRSAPLSVPSREIARRLKIFRSTPRALGMHTSKDGADDGLDDRLDNALSMSRI